MISTLLDITIICFLLLVLKLWVLGVDALGDTPFWFTCIFLVILYTVFHNYPPHAILVLLGNGRRAVILEVENKFGNFKNLL